MVARLYCCQLRKNGCRAYSDVKGGRMDVGLVVMSMEEKW